MFLLMQPLYISPCLLSQNKLTSSLSFNHRIYVTFSPFNLFKCNVKFCICFCLAFQNYFNTFEKALSNRENEEILYLDDGHPIFNNIYWCQILINIHTKCFQHHIHILYMYLFKSSSRFNASRYKIVVTSPPCWN